MFEFDFKIIIVSLLLDFVLSSKRRDNFESMFRISSLLEQCGREKCWIDNVVYEVLAIKKIPRHFSLLVMVHV